MGCSKYSNDDNVNHVLFFLGMNKKRPRPVRLNENSRLCRSLRDFQGNGDMIKCSNESCKFSHDVKDFLENKPSDLPGECYLFNKYGKCSYGLTCR